MPFTSQYLALRALWLAIGVSLLIGACQASPLNAEAPWSPADLRQLDAADAIPPGQDLMAVYTRTLAGELQIRIDLLDMPAEPVFDLYLALDLAPGGRQDLPLSTASSLAWEVLLSIPADGHPATRSANPNTNADLIPRVWRDPDLDTLVVGINLGRLEGYRGAFRLEALAAAPGGDRPADRLGPVRSDAREARRAPVLLAFWHTFPAYTPAQAVRRWDGAHTGPYGERHGLRNLLEAAGRHATPLVLLDLKSPPALSALDFIGVLPQVTALSRQRRLDLPDTVYFARQLTIEPSPLPPSRAAVVHAAVQSRQVGLAFGLPSATALYSPWPLEQPLPGYRLVLTPGPPGTSVPEGLPSMRLAVWRETLLALLPRDINPGHLTKNGLSLVARRDLISRAVLPGAPGWLENGGVLVLGGDLGKTAWGDPLAAERALAYLRAHPWVRPIGLAELADTRPSRHALPPPAPPAAPLTPFTTRGAPLPSGLTSTTWQDALRDRLGKIPSERMADLAWETYLGLLAPNPPETPPLAALRASHLEPIGWLAEAAAWAANPRPRVDCDSDPDLDGLRECVLASDRIFSIIEPHGARLVLLVAQAGAADQWVAPSAQFVIGLGDPATWEPSRGPAGDPAAIPGAFQSSAAPWEIYRIRTLAGGLAFESPGGERRQTYTLTPGGLRVTMRAAPGETLSAQIPLVVPPPARFEPGWADRVLVALPDPQVMVFGLTGGPRIEITSDGRIAYQSFIDGRAALSTPEDPNQNFPPGYFLPFPMTLVTVSGESPLSVDLSF